MPLNITVTLKSKTANYDLDDEKNLSTVKRVISTAIKASDRKILTEFQTKLQALSSSLPVVTEQLTRITAALSVPVAIPQAAYMPPVQQLVYQASYRNAPVEAEHLETGESSFQQLYAHLMLSMLENTSSITHMITYSALVVNMFMHVATFTPYEGQGKAQKREFNHKSQLEYYRSQGNHAQAALYKKLTPDGEGVCRLPFNEGFIKLIGGDDFSPSLGKELKKINLETGFPNSGETVKGFVMTQIAHAGARKNNFSSLTQGMRLFLKGTPEGEKKEALKNKLTAVLPSTKSIQKLNTIDCANRIKGYLTQFKKMSQEQKTIPVADKNLASHLLTYRIHRAEAIKAQVAALNFQHISVDDGQKNITNLMIRLYPNCQDTSDTYTEGVTNVLLSFFSGILNHLAQKNGLSIYANRRQSFGFLRPTVTDAGCLVIRLSLGVEPTSFDALVITALKEFEILLGEFRFDDKTHVKVSDVFKFNKAEKVRKEGGRKPKDPDTYIRNVVRKDDRTLTTFKQAKAYIDEAYQTNAPNYLSHAMTSFLDEYVYQNKKIKTPLANVDDNQLVEPVETMDSPIVDLLKNTLFYVRNFAEKLTFLSVDEPLEGFNHPYLHSLHKLLINYKEAEALLSKIGQLNATTFNHQALMHIENILEYLISLEALRQIRLDCQGVPCDPIAALKHGELDYVKKELSLEPSQLSLFFTDSGQQAITAALLTLSIELHGPARDGRTYDADIFLFNKSYYEVAEFIKDCKADHLKLEIHRIEHAKIIFSDISQIENIELDKCTAMKALVIDITNYPLLDKPEVKDIIAKAQARGVMVTLVESYLKHSQLGLDKYQAGKITVIHPQGQALTPASADIFESISDHAIHPSTASYLLMVNDICYNKSPLNTPPSEAPPLETQPNERELTSRAALINRGFSLGGGNQQLNNPLPDNASLSLPGRV